jgi:hypothetical protein
LAAKKNYYFNEETFQELLKKYQEITVLDDNGNVSETDVELEKKIIKEIDKIVNAVIMVHKYYVFEDYDDLKQHALHACYKNFLKFHPDKGTCFNYFSIISSRSLLNYTTRKQKHRNHQNIEDHLELEHKEFTNYEMFFDGLEDTLFEIIDENFIGKKRQEFTRIAAIIIDYLRKSQVFIGKSDLYAWSRSLGAKNAEVRNFIKVMQEYKTEIFGVLK